MPVPSTTVPALTLENLTIDRGAHFRLKLDKFSLDSGTVACLVGANGSGKTTLIETIVNLLRPDNGTITIAGQALGAGSMQAKRILGFIPDDDGWIIPELTAQEFFDLSAAIYRQAGVPYDMTTALQQLSEYLLFTAFHQPLGSLSHGNRKKVQIISALMHNPQFIIADELRNGLDPIVIARAEALLKDRAQHGAAILAATHDLWWAERFADEILMLQAGNVVLHDTTAHIIEEAGSVQEKFLSFFREGAEV